MGGELFSNNQIWQSILFENLNSQVGIILSGANKDGAFGLKKLKDAGGLTIVQDPKECQVKTMTLAAMKETNVDHIFTARKIINFVQTLE